MFKNKWYNNVIKCLVICVIALAAEPVFAGNCDGILTKDAADLIAEVFTWIRILIPILLIILGAVDFGTAVISEDKDALKKNSSKFVKRCIAAVAVFFIPLIVEVLIDISGIAGTIIQDPSCTPVVPR